MRGLGKGFPEGIAARGSPTHKNDHNRSLHHDLLEKNFEDRKDVAWFSLQLQPNDEAKRLIEASENVTDLAPHISDFASTASLIESMDTGITTVQEYVNNSHADTASSEFEASAMEETS